MRPARRRILLEEYDLQRTGTNRRTGESGQSGGAMGGAPPPKVNIPATITASEAAAQTAPQLAPQPATQPAAEASQGHLAAAASRGTFHLTLDNLDVNDLYIEVSATLCSVLLLVFIFTSCIGLVVSNDFVDVIVRVNNVVTCSPYENTNYNVCCTCIHLFTHIWYTYIHE